MNEAYNALQSMIGKGEADAAIQDYLTTGGQNLDPQTTAWCAAAVNASLSKAGVQGTGSNMARSFLDWGSAVDKPQVGDLAVFSRGDPNGVFGHVGFFDGYNEDGTIRVLGGNQGDSVSVSSYSPSNLLGFRRGDFGQSTAAPVQANALAGVSPQQRQQQPQTPQNVLAQMGWQPQQNDVSAFLRPQQQIPLRRLSDRLSNGA